jgi:hypothetical protein
MDEYEETTFQHDATAVPGIVCGVYHVPFSDIY